MIIKDGMVQEWDRSWFATIRPAVVPTLAFMVTVAVFLPPAMRGVDSHHDGFMLKCAMDVFSGQTIHKDTFTQYGVLSTYLQVGFLWAFGASLLSLKIGTVLCYGVTAAFLVASWRMFLPPLLLAVSLLVWLALPDFYSSSSSRVFLCWSSVYALMFQSISMYFLLRTLKSRSVMNPVLCGATGALVAWCRLPVGGVHGVAVVAVLAIMVYASPERKRYLGALAAFLVGTALVHAAFFASLWWAGSIHHWYYQNIAWPAYWVSLAEGNDSRRDKVLHAVRKLFLLDPLLVSVGQWYSPGVPLRSQGLAPLLLSMLIVLGLIGLLAIPQFRPPASSDGLDRRRFPYLATFLPLVLFTAIEWLYLHDAYDVLELPYGFAIPVVILAATLVTLWRHFSRPRQFKDPASPDALVLACGLISLVSWLQFYPASDPRHQFWGIAPGVGLFVYCLFRSVGGRVPAVAAGILLFAFPLGAGRVIQVAEAGPHARIPGDSILAGVYVPADDLPRWNALLDAVDRQVAARPDIPMLLRGPDGLFGTLVKNLRNPSPFFISWSKEHTSESAKEHTNTSESAPAVDWSRFGVPNHEAKHQAFFDNYHPIIYLREGDSELLNYYGKLNYKVIAKEKGLSRSGVVLMARDSLGSDAAPRVVEK